ncbi:MAG: hypothetical protein SFZ03_12400 [Candidatus Melainabacteria bacterium]|nr:hypothetical protein [Candidatus Melainabacteria bacterium]
MGLPEIEDLQKRVQASLAELSRCQQRYGEDSLEYKQALKGFAAAWFVLKKTREPEVFIQLLYQHERPMQPSTRCSTL